MAEFKVRAWSCSSIEVINLLYGIPFRLLLWEKLGLWRVFPGGIAVNIQHKGISNATHMILNYLVAVRWNGAVSDGKWLNRAPLPGGCIFLDPKCNVQWIFWILRKGISLIFLLSWLYYLICGNHGGTSAPFTSKGKKIFICSISHCFHFLCRTEEAPAAQQPAKPQTQANGTGNLGQTSTSGMVQPEFFTPSIWFLQDQTLLKNLLGP